MNVQNVKQLIVYSWLVNNKYFHDVQYYFMKAHIKFILISNDTFTSVQCYNAAWCLQTSDKLFYQHYKYQTFNMPMSKTHKY